MLRAYKYRIYPNKTQQKQLAMQFGCNRFVYNWALAEKIKAYEADKAKVSCFDLNKKLTELKKKEEYVWLQDVTAQSLQQSLSDLDNAFTRFFREKKGFPKFKSKKHNKNSCRFPQNFKINFEQNKIILPKLKAVKCIYDRHFEGIAKSITVNKTSTNKYFVSILVDTPNEIPSKPKIKEKTTIGIDLGITHFATLSTGEKIDNPRNLKNCLKRLKILQKRASRKQTGSNNHKKANLKVALIHEKITNRRDDFLHKLSHRLTHENQVKTLALETLRVSNMLKNHNLAQAISDVSWSKFNNFIEYKSKWYGRNIIRVGAFQPSSKICSCGAINNSLSLSDRQWTCESCYIAHDRDILAAQNIKRFALQAQNLVYNKAGCA